MEVVGAVVEVILAKVISLAAEQISHALGFKEEFSTLHDSLTVIQALLQDADRRQEEDPAVRVWLQKLRDVAYEANDVLDEFAYDVLRQKLEGQNQIMEKRLEMHRCLKLTERCTKESGPEWHKIAHIPSIQIDSQCIQ
ncbi:hypothetical protein COLO4_24442 [Corchorus olitorius]|uniref:Disease resistance N-terminal domain-containing protein n=1 Tax=Corchorus olitorius TaxID=93759 RepID=A0A1R3IA21_9ROSI|nr:hypothetical protein COLO4_24442 [Corchorus olitorius]